MANTNAGDTRRSMLRSLGSPLHAFRHRPRGSEDTNPSASIPTTPTAGFATTPGLITTSPIVASPQQDGHTRRLIASLSNPTRRPVTEAPPPYSRRDTVDRPPQEDRHAFLSKFDTIFVIDDSTSMEKHWREVNAILANIAPICTEYDEDGIDIYFLNHYNAQAGQAERAAPPPGKAAGGYNNVRDADEVAQIFGAVVPDGNTPTGGRLRSILQPYLRLYEEKLGKLRLVDRYGELDPKAIKPINVIVITDGQPDDDLDVELVAAAKKLDGLEAPLNQVGIQFFQVGNEQGAAEYFQNLDDNLGKDVLGGLHRDIVDTVTWDTYRRDFIGANPVSTLGLSADGILKVVLGAVVKRLDRQPMARAAAAVTQNADDGSNPGNARGSL